MNEFNRPTEYQHNPFLLTMLKDSYKMVEIGNAQQGIGKDILTAPKTAATSLFSSYALGHISRAKEHTMHDALFYAGVATAHLKAHTNRLEDAVEVENGWYVADHHGWENGLNKFQNGLQSYNAGYKTADKVLPETFINKSEELWGKWFESHYNMPLTDEVKHILKNPKVISMPFDHGIGENSFINSVCHYPAFMERPAFNYMKAWSFPPTWFRSDLMKNDYLRFQEMKASELGLSLEDRLYTGGIHEGTELYVAPMLELALKSNPHSWFQEGIAQYYSTLNDIGMMQRYNKISSPARATDAHKPVDYPGSLLLTMTAAAELNGYSAQNIQGGIEHMLDQLAEYAGLVADKNIQPMTKPVDLLSYFLPELRGENKRKYSSMLHRQMGVVKNMILAGEFVQGQR